MKLKEDAMIELLVKGGDAAEDAGFRACLYALGLSYGWVTGMEELHESTSHESYYKGAWHHFPDRLSTRVDYSNRLGLYLLIRNNLGG